MAYHVSWSIFVFDDEIDPIEAAKRAREMQSDPEYAVYGLHNIETGHICLVDLRIPRIIEPEYELKEIYD